MCEKVGRKRENDKDRVLEKVLGPNPKLFPFGGSRDERGVGEGGSREGRGKGKGKRYRV